MSRFEWISRPLRSGRSRFTLATVVLLVVGALLSFVFWDWLTTFWDLLQAGTDSRESASTTIRNIGLVIAGLVALPLAIWRSLVAERQAGAAQRQADAAQQSLLNERYQRGAEMLGNEVLSVRLGGIYALQRLAEERPEQYHIQIMRLFCSFARNPAREEQHQAPEDVEAVLSAIGARQVRQLELELQANFELDLRFANLSLNTLADANLSNAQLWHVNLSEAGLNGTDLSDAQLWEANLSSADLDDANLSGAEFSEGDGHSCATGLTQAQLDTACADPANPPKLDGVVDAETGEPLVWRGKPLDE